MYTYIFSDLLNISASDVRKAVNSYFEETAVA